MKPPFPKLTENFGGREMYQNRHGYVPDSIPDIMVDRMRAHGEVILEPWRASLDHSAITINRWWADEYLNVLQGGVKNSQHTFGEATDCRPHYDIRMAFERLIRSNLPFDQAIYYPKRGFIHVSHKSDRALDYPNRLEALVNPYTKAEATVRTKARKGNYYNYDLFYHGRKKS